jgi:hypothetical protein
MKLFLTTRSERIAVAFWLSLLAVATLLVLLWRSL